MRPTAEPAVGRRTASIFAAGLLDPDRPEPEMLAAPANKATRKRYAVYRNNVVAGLAKALGEIFPAVRRIVGEEFFAGMARVHIRECPPRSPLLFAYGADFPDFIERFEPAGGLPYLADVARIERAWLDAHHAADSGAVDAAFLGSVAAERLDELRFEPHPAMRILRSRFAAHTIFTANRREDPPDRIDASRPETSLVTRPWLTVVSRRIDPGEAAFLEGLARGASLSTALETGLAMSTAFDPAAAITLIVESGALLPRGAPGSGSPASLPPPTVSRP